jgi:hypothetical protein
MFGFDFQVSHKQQVDDVHGVIRLRDNDGSPTGHRHDEIAMLNRKRPTVRQMNEERLKWLRFVKFL